MQAAHNAQPSNRPVRLTKLTPAHLTCALHRHRASTDDEWEGRSNHRVSKASAATRPAGTREASGTHSRWSFSSHEPVPAVPHSTGVGAADQVRSGADVAVIIAAEDANADGQRGGERERNRQSKGARGQRGMVPGKTKKKRTRVRPDERAAGN